MRSDDQEQLIKLAAQIAVEKDPQTFHALVAQLNDLLEEKERRLPKQVNQSRDQHSDKN